VVKETEAIGTFANNDIVHHDPTGADHESFSFGLKKSLLNYMHHLGLDESLNKWFDFKVPKPLVAPAYIEQALINEETVLFKGTAKMIWLGTAPSAEYFTQSKKGMQREMATLNFISKVATLQIQILKAQAEWLIPMLEKLQIHNLKTYTLQEVMDSYDAVGLEDFELFWDNKPMNGLWKIGLLRL